MIEIVKMREYDKILDKDIIPPQLMPYWYNIFDDGDNASYVAYSGDWGKADEQISFVTKKTPFGKFLFSMPFIGYGCCFDSKNKEIASQLCEIVEDFARTEGCLSMSICTHPLSNIPLEYFHNIWDYSYYHTNFTQMLPIGDNHPVERMNHDRRHAIKNEVSYVPKKSDFKIFDDTTIEEFNEWYQVYCKLCDEQRAIAQHVRLFMDYYLESKKGNIDFWVLKDNNRVIGGIFFARGKGMVDYNTSAFDSDFKGLCPTTHVLYHYFEKLKSEGVQYFNMQSSKKRDDGTYQYKKRWGASEMPHFYFSKPLVDVEQITSIPLEVIKAELPGCYLLPFSLWGEEVKK